MGLLDDYFDQEQFQASGGLLGRLLSLPQMQGLDQLGVNQPLPAPQAPALAPLSWPAWALDGSSQPPAPDLHSQYQALRPVLGDRNAMLATVQPEMGQTPIAQALASQQAGNAGNTVSAGDSRPAAQDGSSNPVNPGLQYAQAPLGLCTLGPAGCFAGAGLTAGQILGGAALLGGAAILNNNSAGRPPAGSRPINQTDWSGDHPEIKRAVGAQPNDDVRISPTGDVWAQKPDGSWENHGPADTFTGSGNPRGRRGKDRDR